MDLASVFFFFFFERRGRSKEEKEEKGIVRLGYTGGRILEEKNRFSFEQLSNLLQEMGDNEGNNNTGVGSWDTSR